METLFCRCRTLDADPFHECGFHEFIVMASPECWTIDGQGCAGRQGLMGKEAPPQSSYIIAMAHARPMLFMCVCTSKFASECVYMCVCWCVLYAYAVRRCIDRHTHSVTSTTAASRASQSTTFVLQSIGGSSSSCPNVNRHNKTRFETYTRRHHLSSFPPMTIVVASLTHRRTALHCPHQQHCTKFCLERKKKHLSVSMFIE